MVQKRPDSALRIWASLEAKFPEWELIFLGDGPDRVCVENLSNSLNLVHVKFKGFVDPLPFYRESSILCMTSDYEGFGLALAEAMQFGVVPIVFDNWSSLKDIIIHNETGLLIPQGDMAGYGENLELLMKDDHLRKRLSDNAKVFVRKFSIDEIGKKWLNLFNELAVT
jgi:glycosyltransferase involved in cell wall biosynthesis